MFWVGFGKYLIQYPYQVPRGTVPGTDSMYIEHTTIMLMSPSQHSEHIDQK